MGGLPTWAQEPTYVLWLRAAFIPSWSAIVGPGVLELAPRLPPCESWSWMRRGTVRPFNMWPNTFRLAQIMRSSGSFSNSCLAERLPPSNCEEPAAAGAREPRKVANGGSESVRTPHPQLFAPRPKLFGKG